MTHETSTARRASLWLGLAAVMMAAGFRRRNAAGNSRSKEKAEDNGHGRQAAAPSEIPAQGWKDILVRVYRRISRDRILAISAGVTFYALLAIFPAIAALVSIYGLFSNPADVSNQLSNLSGILPGGAMDIVGEQMHRVASKGSGSLSAAFIVSLAIALWSANAGMKAIFDALNVAYEEEEKRGFFKLNAVTLLFTLSGIAFALIAVVIVVVLPNALGYLGLGNVTGWLVAVGKWPALLIIVAAAIALLYRYGPSRDDARWRWITWGSAFAAVFWLIASLLFAWYAANLGSYNKTYGSLGAVIGFMTWIWISTAIVLLGAMINAEMEHQTARDSTEGARKPLGQRGAKMADTIGEAA